LNLAGKEDNFLDPSITGVRATIIDFGLSRLDLAETVWTPLPNELYEGIGKQWDVYRAMRDRIGDDWEGFHPITNALVSRSPMALAPAS